jgi:mono/diheme cytochrome c family protein
MKHNTTVYVAGILMVISLSKVAAQEGAYPIASWSRTTALDETKGTTKEKGQALFNNWCSACHSPDVSNAPGTRSLQVKYQGALPAALEDREDLTTDFVKFFVRDGIATMPFFRPTEISDTELEALAAYLAD